MKSKATAELMVIAGLSLYGCGGTSRTMGTGGEAGAGGATSDMGSCNGSPLTNPSVVRNDCGTFVSAGAPPNGDGTKERPFQTFGDAASAGTHRIFACAGTYTEAKQVSFIDGVEIYGGFFRCETAWIWGDATDRATIMTRADEPGLTLDGGANRLENVNVTAPNATRPGASSTAVLVNGGSLDVLNGVLTAGDAQDGIAGTSLIPDPTLDGVVGTHGANACDPGYHTQGPMGPTIMCPTGGSSTGGNGGDSGDPTGAPAGNGTNGTAMPAATPVGTHDGQRGTGEGQNAAPLCVRGDSGAHGSKGSDGRGASGIGMLTKRGYLGESGRDGANGTPAQGGGGGGGSKGGMSVTCGSMVVTALGANGGAGGTGGCGGHGGGGGQAGGSSIAMLALDAHVSLTRVALTAGKGGHGGEGGYGQDGGEGGYGGEGGSGASLWDGCDGGEGGSGGNGGPGGGGLGGHSLGIAFQGIAAPAGGSFTIDLTKNGKGGAGGNNNTTVDMGKGADGIAADCWDFGSNKACP